MEIIKPVRVIFNTRSFLFRKTGIGYYAHNILEGLLKSKEVVVYPQALRVNKDVSEGRGYVDKYTAVLYILYVGMIEPIENLQVLLKAFKSEDYEEFAHKLGQLITSESLTDKLSKLSIQRAGEKDSGSNNPHILQGSERLKIGINATFLNEKPTGVGFFTGEIISAVFDLNKDIVVFSPISHDNIPQGNIHKVSVAMTGSPRLSNNLYRLFYINTVLPLLCKLRRIKVLYCPITEFPFVLFTPLVVHVHDLHPIHFPSQFGLGAIRFRLALKVLNKRAARITVCSDFIKGELLELTDIEEDKIDVIPNGYNRRLFKPQSPGLKEDFLGKYSIPGAYILTVGSLFPYKNTKTLINAFLKIKKKIRHSLVIVGRREFSSELLPADERIFYMDYVPHEDLPKFYSYADAFVHPSLSEGFGLSPLEAMACGAPVISSNAGSLPEVVGKAGMLFNPLDTEHLSRLIEEVVKNEGFRRELIKKGLENAKRFSWEKTAAGILTSCERAVKEGG